MAYDLSTITSDTIARPPRIVLLGIEKIGKSTFASCFPSPVMLPVKGEEGLDDPEIRARARVLPVCETSQDIFGWLGSLGQSEHTYQTIVIDSASTAEALINAEICAKVTVPSINEGSLSFGVGTDQALGLWRTISEYLDALRSCKGMTSILIGHVKVKRFDDPNGESYDQYQWDVHQKIASLLYRWADSILFCNTKVVVKKEKLGFSEDNVKKRGIDIAPGSRFLYTQKRPAHPGGGRGVYGRLDYELPLDWQEFQNAIDAAR